MQSLFEENLPVIECGLDDLLKPQEHKISLYLAKVVKVTTTKVAQLKSDFAAARIMFGLILKMVEFNPKQIQPANLKFELI